MQAIKKHIWWITIVIWMLFYTGEKLVDSGSAGKYRLITRIEACEDKGIRVEERVNSIHARLDRIDKKIDILLLKRK